jgi:hypothetical protein
LAAKLAAEGAPTDASPSPAAGAPNRSAAIEVVVKISLAGMTQINSLHHFARLYLQWRNSRPQCRRSAVWGEELRANARAPKPRGEAI